MRTMNCFLWAQGIMDDRRKRIPIVYGFVCLGRDITMDLWLRRVKTEDSKK